MHPILANLRRLSVYLAGWVPLAALVVYLLKTAAGFTWAEAAALGTLLCLFYAFICLSAWYPCRLTPLRFRAVQVVLATHLAGGLVASAIWVLVARVLAALLSSLHVFAGLDAHLGRALGLLFGLGILFYLLSVAMDYILLAVEASRQAEEREAQAQILAREAELRALKAQVNPHFLFNSLNSISALTTLAPSKAREMCVLLGDFLRKTLGLGEKSMIPLREEMALVDGYLRVEKVRFGSRLAMEEQLEPAALDVAVPPLLLQPLVENAVLHGISNLPEGGWIRLRARRRQDELEIVVENKFDHETPPARRHGVGLENVRRRLEACYGSRASLSAGADGGCFRVILTLPLEAKEDRGGWRRAAGNIER
ncbi:MAG TPA: histidine kinase [Terriglobia bacterium]|nr:histidine kinase [Terriglobia bacterium]